MMQCAMLMKLAIGKPYQHKQATRFSLIELLIVIALLSILMSALSPALKKALKTGRTQHCLNNLHQLSNSRMIYADDNDDIVPTGLSYSHISNTPWYAKNEAWEFDKNNYEKYQKTIFKCPQASVIEPRWTPGPMGCGYDYSMNANQGGRYQPNGTVPLIPRMSMLPPSAWWLADGALYLSSPKQQFYFSEYSALLFWMWMPEAGGIANPGFLDGHIYNSCSFAFGDGHVESLMKEEYDTRMQQPSVDGKHPFSGKGDLGANAYP